jgi:hypothetical protein
VLQFPLLLWCEAVLGGFAFSVFNLVYVRFEIFTAVTIKNGVFWDVTPCGSCKNGHFGGM